MADRLQVNVQLDQQEYSALRTICAAENIKTPTTLVGIWVREKLKGASDMAKIMDLVSEARASGIDIERVLSAALLRKGRRNAA